MRAQYHQTCLVLFLLGGGDDLKRHHKAPLPHRTSEVDALPTDGVFLALGLWKKYFT